MIIELEDEHESFQKYQDHVAVHRALREKIHAAGYVEIYKDHINTIFVQKFYEQDVQDAWKSIRRGERIMKICILTIATNKYIHFVQELYDNIEEFFLPGHEKTCLLFTDHELEEVSDNVRVHTIDHEPYPMPTLKRYNYFMKEKDFILEHDYCFYFDVDMAY